MWHVAVTSQSTSPGGNDPVISVRHLAKEFHLGASLFSRKREQVVSAVADVSFDVERGRTLGIVGESGCGKSTTARCILRLVEPTSGEIYYRKLSSTDQTIEEIDLGQASESELRRFRSDLQIVFQDPVASFNPRMTVGASVSEPLVVNTDLTRDEREGRTQELLELVGLESGHSQRYPHEFSGGQRQRIGVARALALNPSFIVCDEPVSALDVSIQAQVLNLLSELQEELALTYLFISHDLAVVRQICDEVAVMYLGKIVEQARVEKLFSEPTHPYTHALLSAAPVANPNKQRKRQRILLEGDAPSPINPPPGCRFRSRCETGRSQDLCRDVEPPLTDDGEGHLVACHFPEVKSVI